MSEICRDDACLIERLHTTKLCRFAFVDDRKPKRQRLAFFRSKKRPWQLTDREGLIEAVLRAVSDQPTTISWIARDVRDDYGQVTDRSIYRYVRRLVAQERLVKVEVGLHLVVYTKPKARVLREGRDGIRDIMLGLVEITACAKDSFA